jgi:AcrR family transcriptional regulator
MTALPPMEQGRRRYDSPTRRRQGEETRRRILAAARERFLSAGYAGTTLDGIARDAGVSPKTVSATFGSKRGILAALLSPDAFGSRFQAIVGHLQEAEDPAQRLRLAAQLTRHAFDGLAAEFDLLRGASVLAPELADLARQVEARRRQNLARLVAYLGDRKVLRPELPPEEATDVLWALTAYDLYRLLVVERGWSSDHYEAWLADTLSQRLLDLR